MRDSGFVSGTVGCVSKIEAIELEHAVWESMCQTDAPRGSIHNPFIALSHRNWRSMSD